VFWDGYVFDEKLKAKENIEKTIPNHGRIWTKDDDKILLEGYKNGKSIKELSNLLLKGDNMNTDKKYVKCDVCQNDVLIDSFGNGDECIICGWRQSEESFDHPDIAGIRNIPSLNNAIKQFKEGKSAIVANFNDFIMAFKNYGELEFTYNNVRYGILFDDATNKIVLLNISDKQKQYFESIDDFEQNANIDGVHLKVLWNSVTNTDFLQDTY